MLKLLLFSLLVIRGNDLLSLSSPHLANDLGCLRLAYELYKWSQKLTKIAVVYSLIRGCDGWMLVLSVDNPSIAWLRNMSLCNLLELAAASTAVAYWTETGRSLSV